MRGSNSPMPRFLFSERWADNLPCALQKCRSITTSASNKGVLRAHRRRPPCKWPDCSKRTRRVQDVCQSSLHCSFPCRSPPCVHIRTAFNTRPVGLNTQPNHGSARITPRHCGSSSWSLPSACSSRAWSSRCWSGWGNTDEAGHGGVAGSACCGFPGASRRAQRSWLELETFDMPKYVSLQAQQGVTPGNTKKNICFVFLYQCFYRK